MVNNRVDPSTKRILIVDDEESLLEFLRFHLEREGFKVEVAYDGQSALDKAKAEKPDLIILDAYLPKKSGYEVVKSLQQIFQLRDVPVIVITGRYRDPQTRQMFCFEPNVKDYMLKPVQPDLLISRVHNILNTRPKEEDIIEEKLKEYKKRFME